MLRVLTKLRMLRTLFTALALALCLNPGLRADPVDDLVVLLAPLDGLRGQFEQLERDQKGRELRRSSGIFALLKPGYFAWDVQTPDSQLLLANPDYIWHYDRDLETATRRSATVEQQISPMQVLGGDEQAIRRHFAVTRTQEGVYRLSPMADNPLFVALQLIFEDGILRGMEITDNLEHQLSITLILDTEASPPTLAEFEFTPPPGVDLFYDD